MEDDVLEWGAETETRWSGGRGYSSLDSPTSSEVSLDTVRLGTSGARLGCLPELRCEWCEGRAWPEPQLAQWAWLGPSARPGTRIRW